MNAVNPLEEDRLRQAVDLFWEAIPPFWGQIRAHLHSLAVEQYAISVEQFHILRHIRKGCASVSELAEAKGISRAAISQGVDALVNKGLVQRLPNPQDRRYVPLTLTASGNALLDDLIGQTRAWMNRRLDHLSQAELESLAAAFEILKNIDLR